MSFGNKAAGIDAPKILDEIEKTVYAVLKPHGFRKHGRTLHRFVSGDISQVINFQLGQSYAGNTHMLSVNIGIRVPECVLRSFQSEDKLKKYYHEYECNLRSRLGTVENRKEDWYDLRNPAADIAEDIVRQIRDIVLPAFETLSRRENILAHRREYPNMDRITAHLISLDEAMIYGRLGNLPKAQELFHEHYRRSAIISAEHHYQGHLKYLNELAEKLGMGVMEWQM